MLAKGGRRRAKTIVPQLPLVSSLSFFPKSFSWTACSRSFLNFEPRRSENLNSLPIFSKYSGSVLFSIPFWSKCSLIGNSFQIRECFIWKPVRVPISCDLEFIPSHSELHFLFNSDVWRIRCQVVHNTLCESYRFPQRAQTQNNATNRTLAISTVTFPLQQGTWRRKSFFGKSGSYIQLTNPCSPKWWGRGGRFRCSQRNLSHFSVGKLRVCFSGVRNVETTERGILYRNQLHSMGLSSVYIYKRWEPFELLYVFKPKAT